MKWIGQHIFDLIARFRSSVIMESLPTETPTSFLGVNASNEVVKGAITATKTTAGVVELATTAETTTGTNELLAVTPDGLKDGYQGSTNVTTLGTIATGVWNGTAISQAYIGAEAINESKLQVSNAPVNGYMLTAQSGNTGGLTWAVIPTDANTQNTTTLSFVDSSNDILLRNTTGGAGSGTDDIKFVAGTNVTLTHTDADNITIASTDTNTNIANTDLTANANRTLDLDSNNLTFSNVGDFNLGSQAAPASEITLHAQVLNIKSSSGAPDFRIYEDSDNGTNYAKFTFGALGANRTYTLPDATGTVALTSNIPTGNSIIDWTGASAGTIHSTNIPTLNQNTTGSAATLTTAKNIGGVSFNGSANIDLPGVNETGDQDTSGNAATATALTTGNKDITGTLNVKTTTATANPFISFSQTTTRRAFIQLADNNAGFQNHLRIASEYGPVSIAAASTAGSDTDTVFFMVEPTGIFKFGAVDSDAVLTTDGNMTFRIDADNDETSQKFIFQNNASTEIASISESGDLSVSGAITGKQKEIYFNNFDDKIGTTQLYIPFKSVNEQTNPFVEEAAFLSPTDGRVVSVTVRGHVITGSGEVTISVRTCGLNVSASSTTFTIEESKAHDINTADDHHAFHFVFDNAKHFESGELVAIGIKSDTNIDGFPATSYWYVTTVVEYDWANQGFTAHQEYDSAQ